MNKLLLKFAFLMIMLIPLNNYAQGDIPKQEKPSKEELGIYEQLDSIVDGDLVFTTTEGKQVKLSEIIDRPTALSLVYYKCPGICTVLMNGVSDVIKQTDMVLGPQYQVLTISFDPTEGPGIAKQKKDNYLKVNASQDVKNHWYFLTGDSANIAKLLAQTGFHVKKSGAQYIHPGALIMLSPKRKITRYLNGSYYNPFDFKMALVEASKEQSGPTINKVLNYCFSYDPAGKKYVFNITKVAGSIVIFFAALLLIFMIIGERKRKKLKQSNQ